MAEDVPASSARRAPTRSGVAPEQLAETQIRSLLDGQPDAALVLSARGAVLHANPAAERLFGKQPRGMRGLQLGLPWVTTAQAEVEVLGPAGRQVACELRLQAAPWAGTRAVLATLRDVSARTQAEEALRESQERYELAARAANDGLWDWDLESGALYFSPRWRSMLGAGE